MGAPTQAADGQLQLPAQFVEVRTAAVLQLDALAVVPDALVGIEVRRIGRELGEVEARGGARGEEVLHGLPAVDRCPVPDHQQLASNLAEQLAEERDHVWSPPRFILDMGKELPGRGDSTDHRKMVAGERRAQHRRLAAGGVGAGNKWQRVEAGFVSEQERAALRLGFA